MLVSLLYVDVNSVDEAALLDHQVVQLLVNRREFVDRLDQLVDFVVLPFAAFLDLQHLLLNLEHPFLLLGQLDGPVFARALILPDSVIVLSFLLP